MPLCQLAVMLLATALGAASACKAAPPAPAADIDLAGMDKSAAPGDGFNAYVNGGWIKRRFFSRSRAVLCLLWFLLL